MGKIRQTESRNTAKTKAETKITVKESYLYPHLQNSIEGGDKNKMGNIWEIADRTAEAIAKKQSAKQKAIAAIREYKTAKRAAMEADWEFRNIFRKTAKISIRQLKHFADNGIYPTVNKEELTAAIQHAEDISEIKRIINQAKYVIDKMEAIRQISNEILYAAMEAGYLTETEVTAIKEIKQKLQ